MPALANIFFNLLKHHRGYIHQQIALATADFLPELLNKPSNSQMNIYHRKYYLK
ncbi:hypothetical protein SIO70_13105 [Chitinophaga sancti]|uniref:hypothetical protein n=1 Tax=Chitinophaga sancti TaxID=1004 RepID=UPI002A748113|nr:hypothetical protein [Chitinophaga sancti]WPQ65792.1 hypothetical protein SIO70_13105 [Chitinophaga sancti]